MNVSALHDARVQVLLIVIGLSVVDQTAPLQVLGALLICAVLWLGRRMDPSQMPETITEVTR